jgi:hypothetical protein
MCEGEARALRFEIDHYEPQALRGDLVNVYSNLMYSCEECNNRKGDLSPPDDARAAGVRFFRPDLDHHGDHFGLVVGDDEMFVEGISSIGEFTVEYCDLNRLALRKLRKIRREISEVDQFVAHGVALLKRFPIDSIAREQRGRAASAIKELIGYAEEIGDDIDDLLSTYARSELLDADPESEQRAKSRRAKMKEFKALYPGEWRSRGR